MEAETLLETPDKQWTVKQRTWCVKAYIKCNKIGQIRADFLQEFQTTKAPDHKRIYAWVKKFDEHGTVENLNKKSDNRATHSGRKRIRDAEMIERVRQDVENSPKRSTRKRSQSLSIGRCTLRRTLKDDLGKFPYHIQTKHKQDGATPHTAKISREWLTEHFGRRIISSKFPIEWAPHSPDLSPPDFFLWGYLKDRVYQEKPRNLTDLKKKNSEEIKAIKPQVCKDVMNNFCVRLKKCKNLKGGHLEHLL